MQVYAEADVKKNGKNPHFKLGIGYYRKLYTFDARIKYKPD